MIICKETNEVKAAKLIECLSDDMPYMGFSWDSKSGNIIEDGMLTGEELFKKFGYSLLWKKSSITVFLQGKEHVICSKSKLWESKDFDNYNEEITNAFWLAYKQGLITGEELTSKQIIQQEETK